MFIFQFITEYCQDLVTEAKKTRQLIDLSEYPHDYVITDIEGNKVPVVSVDGQDVPVNDFLTMDRDVFISVWNTPSAPTAFDNYISAFIVLEGEDALSRIRNEILAEKEQLLQETELITCL